MEKKTYVVTDVRKTCCLGSGVVVRSRFDIRAENADTTLRISLTCPGVSIEKGGTVEVGVEPVEGGIEIEGSDDGWPTVSAKKFVDTVKKASRLPTRDRREAGPGNSAR